jgi:hypothetical protein
MLTTNRFETTVETDGIADLVLDIRYTRDDVCLTGYD